MTIEQSQRLVRELADSQRRDPVTEASGEEFNRTFHKCRAEISRDLWDMVWQKAVAWSQVKGSSAASAEPDVVEEAWWLIESTVAPRPLYYAGHHKGRMVMAEDAAKAVRFPSEWGAKYALAALIGVKTKEPTWPLETMKFGYSVTEHIFDYTPRSLATATQGAVRADADLLDALAKLVCEPGKPEYRDRARTLLAAATQGAPTPEQERFSPHAIERAVFDEMTKIAPDWNAYGRSRESAVRFALRAVANLQVAAGIQLTPAQGEAK